MSEVRTRVKHAINPAEWALADVAGLWLRKSGAGGAIPLKPRLIRKLAQDMGCDVEKLNDAKVAIYVSENMPGCVFVRILPLEVKE
jgi:hypothetical protein